MTCRPRRDALARSITPQSAAKSDSGCACPGPCVVEKIVFDVSEHAVRAQMHKHHAVNLADDEQPAGALAAYEASVREIPLMKAITLGVIIFHGFSESW